MEARQSSSQAGFYFPELDGLRFLAFLLVFIHNAPIDPPSALPKAVHEYGWMGVDLFFSLSAFIITRLLLTEYELTGNIHPARFYARRALRIWPAYFVYIALVLSTYPLQGQPLTPVTWKHILGLTTFTLNLIFPFFIQAVIVLFAHLWTISYEWQFYAVIPWILRKLVSAGDRARWSLMIFAILAGSFVRAIFIHFQIEHPAIYMLPFTRFEAVLGGTAAGLGLFDKFMGRRKAWMLLASGVACSAAVAFLPNVDQIGWNLMLTYPLTGLGMTLIVYSVVQTGGEAFRRPLRNAALAYLGKISYGLYMYHIAGIVVAYEVSSRLGITARDTVGYILLVCGTALTLTILISAVSYRFLERPFLRLKEQFGFISSRPV
jgi:peptidoglycan/LPS O-acetylase OafA/YrhL